MGRKVLPREFQELQYGIYPTHYNDTEFSYIQLITVKDIIY